MPDQILVEYCAPTMAGIKTASLFRLHFDDERKVREDIDEMDRKLYGKGIRVIPMRFDSQYVLLYVYRPMLLRKDLRHPVVSRTLTELGYTMDGDEQKMVAQLAERIQTNQEFPHEIGFFLGYPVEDVVGFMYHRDDGCKKVGYWKVYGNPEKASELFDQYTRCICVYRQSLAHGRSILDLTVNMPCYS